MLPSHTGIEAPTCSPYCGEQLPHPQPAVSVAFAGEWLAYLADGRPPEEACWTLYDRADNVALVPFAYPQLGFLGSDDKRFASLPLRRMRGSNVAFGHQHCAHPALDLIGNEAQQGNKRDGRGGKGRSLRSAQRT